MAIKISGSTIIDDSRNIGNAGIVTATVVGASTVTATTVDATTVTATTVGATTANVTTVSAAGSITAATLYGDGTGISGISTNFTAAIGIQSAGIVVGTGITQLNFVGAGNTFAVNGSTVDISISGSGGGGVSTTGITTGYIWSNPSEINESIDLTYSTHNYGMFGPVTIGTGVTVTVGAGNSFSIV